MGKRVERYRMYCETESSYVYVWSDSVPSVCPNNNTHTVTANSVTVVNRVSENSVKIEEEDTETGITGGNFAVRSFPVSVTANETKATVVSWPIPVSILSIEFKTEDIQKGDVANVYIAHETTIGALSADASSNSATLTVSSTVFDHIMVGYLITLDDGTNKELLGRVIDIDVGNSQISVETATTNSFTAATPTYVKMSIHMMQEYVFGPGGPASIGESKIGGSYLPANTPITIVYKNNTSEAKTWNAGVEFLY